MEGAGGSHILRRGSVEAQCAPLLSFLRAAAVEGLAIPFATSDLEVVAPDKALEAQWMEILPRDLPARFDTGASGGLSPGDARRRHDARAHGVRGAHGYA